MKQAFLLFIVVISAMSLADSKKSETKEFMDDTGRGVKKTTREIKDKTCELIDGKMECAAKKVKHSIQNGADKVEDAVD